MSLLRMCRAVSNFADYKVGQGMVDILMFRGGEVAKISIVPHSTIQLGSAIPTERENP
jgi:hypothetical protein